MKHASTLELTLLHDSLTKRLQVVRDYLPKETDQDKREMRERYIAAMESRIDEIRKRIG